jgi:predicted amidohydrolase
LLIARAIENQCYVAGVNRIGVDGAGVPHAGDSALYDFVGAPRATLGDAADVCTVQLEHAALRQFREKFPAHLDADRFELT